MLKKKIFVLTFVILFMALWSAIPSAQAAPPSGAIFTTTPDGSIVNENVRYESKLEVYLDGGPGPNAPQTAAGLDDGMYVFQVTDPSGWVLLSMDPSKCRVVEVADGVITRLVNPSELSLTDGYEDQDGNDVPACHIQDDPDGAAGVSGRHDTNTDVDHGPPAIVVQLMPFLDTPNPGGVYKAWMIGLDDYLADGGDLEDVPGDKNNEYVRKKGQILGYEEDPGFGPPRNDSKTDNFKVKEIPPMIHVFKFEDLNGNGQWDAGEPELTGWEIHITETLYDNTTVTNVCYTPCWRTVAPDSTVTVTEIIPNSSWELSYVSIDNFYVEPPSVSVDVTFEPGDMAHYVTFGNWRYAQKDGMKFHDLNANGVKDGGEPGLGGWKIHLFGTDGKGDPFSQIELTDANGDYSFDAVPPGEYTVCEIFPANDWYQSFPASGADCSAFDAVHGVTHGPVGYAISLLSGEVDSGNDFGNYQFAEKKGMKFHDLNADGVKDAGEPGLDGWTIHLFGTDGMGNAVSELDVTDVDGYYSFSVPPGNYTVCEIFPASVWNQSFPASGADCSAFDAVHGVTHGPTGYAITLASQEVDAGNDFGNWMHAVKFGYKYHDMNANGNLDAGEPGLENWEIQAWSGGSLVATEYTDENGYFEFMLKPGTYTIKEVCPPDWYQSQPVPTNGCGSGIYADEAFISATTYGPNLFGNFQPAQIMVHKFFDRNGDGIRQSVEEWLEGIEFCLYDAGEALVSADDFVGAVDAACQYTDVAGVALWDGLMPGTYTVKETLPEGFFATKTSVWYGPPPFDLPPDEQYDSAVEVIVTLFSGGEAHLFFGNVVNCVGLTPGYWSNWRNHYTDAQFEELLVGTIANSIAEADELLTSTGCDGEDALACMRRFLLANQLTMNLTQMPELPNPSGGSMFAVCQVPGQAGNIDDWLGEGLAIHEADGVGYDRGWILWVKSILDWFANLNLVYYP